MIENFTLAAILAATVILVILAFIDCLIASTECKHERFAKFDSYHKKMCVDCGEFFSTKEDKYEFKSSNPKIKC